MFKKMIVVAAMALLAISAQVGTASAALFANGGFETGDFTGWTLTNVDLNNDFVMVVPNSGNPSYPPNPGSYEAMLGKSGAVGTMSQTFDTTVGQQYSVKYWLANDMPPSLINHEANVFQAVWNNSIIQATALSNVNAFGYREYLFSAVATADTSTIAFNFQNDPSVFHLDNVDVTPTPIPAAFWLLGSGLAGLAGLRRKKA